MKRAHQMPWGAALHGGTTRFRVWAPHACKLDLLIEDQASRPMQREPDGWWSLSTHAPAGTLYRYRADNGPAVPDPASRRQPHGPHGPSEVVDPTAYTWRDLGWRGRRWDEVVLYELHLGTFSSAGTFLGAIPHLDHVRDLGATALEILPIAERPGARNWGYDGVQLFAPDDAYGTPDEFKTLVEAAHARGLAVVLDVVFNHFGPEGNYVQALAPGFFTEAHTTPWGAAIDFDARPVRDFYLHNALYWLDEFDCDGLRLDAVHAIRDDSDEPIACEIARKLRDRQQAPLLVIENEKNEVRYLERDAAGRPLYFDAQWNDDIHHVMHVLVTGERDGYYKGYADRTVERLGRALAQGFVRHDSAHLPLTAFIAFLQTHDQIGNRLDGERIHMLADPLALEAMTRILLLQPQPPLLFMGEEWAASTVWPYFADLDAGLAALIRESRKEEHKIGASDTAPDPFDEETFRTAKLDWSELGIGLHVERLSLYRRLLALRAYEIVPRLAGMRGGAGQCHVDGSVLRVDWVLGDGSRLHLLANCDNAPAPRGAALDGRVLEASDGARDTVLPPWAVAITLESRGV